MAPPTLEFTSDQFSIKAALLTGFVDEGDLVDLGDRMFRVRYLPGYSPASVALCVEKTGILISGDVVNDGYLFDTVYQSGPEHYRQSMRRLRELDVDIVYAGHGNLFRRDRMRRITDEFIAGGRRIGDLSGWLNTTLGSD